MANISLDPTSKYIIIMQFPGPPRNSN